MLGSKEYVNADQWPETHVGEWAAGACCEPLASQLTDSCDDTAIVYVPRYRRFGLRVLDGGSSYTVIKHCPFCGAAFPTSLVEQWFEELERLGIEDPREAPAELQSESWWRARGL